ncbi:MAG: trkH [Rhodospirillaceae bacterium]|nr:MAG: trkH [Rhodospirillaceae bacterium]
MRHKTVGIDGRPVCHLIGVLLLVLAGAMLLPAVVDVMSDHNDWRVFFASAGVTGVAGGVMTVAYRPAGAATLSTRQAFLLTTGSWVVVCLFASLPFLFSSLDMSLADAYFETMSGLTTTGSTVIVGLDRAPPGILLWRSLLQGLGGIGIIVMAVAVLPDLRIGGMQLFRMESSDKTDKVMPRVSQMASMIIVIYVLLNMACALALWASGMNWFDAITHAPPVVSTGGFSTYDESVGHFHSPLIEWILVAFMMLGATTFTLYVALLRHKGWRLLRGGAGDVGMGNARDRLWRCGAAGGL